MKTKKDKVYCIDCAHVHNCDEWGLNNDWWKGMCKKHNYTGIGAM
jgi:hypothetical protein